MSKRYAEIENDVICNVFIADEDFVQQFKPNAIECPDGIGVGDKFEDGSFLTNSTTEVLEVDETPIK